MLTPKTTALIAAMSVLGTVAPAAFAQDLADPGDVIAENDIVVGVISQSNEVGDISQSIEQNAFSLAATGDYSKGDASSSIEQEASQGFCLQQGNSAAVAGRDATAVTANEIQAEAEAEDDSEAEAEVDCS
jgi:hypothetical protein